MRNGVGLVYCESELDSKVVWLDVGVNWVWCGCVVRWV